QHHICDPNRDKSHGRIYRITYEGRPLLKPAKIDGQPIAALLDLLKEPENDVRTRVKIELGKHASAEVIAAVKKWAAKLDPSDPAEVALEVLEKEADPDKPDYYIKYCLDETMKALDKYTR